MKNRLSIKEINKKLILLFAIITVLMVILSATACSQRTPSSDINDQVIEESKPEEEEIGNKDAEISVEEPEVEETAPSQVMRIGASAVTEPSRLTLDVAVVEARYLIGREQNFWDVVDICIGNNIFLIANIVIRGQGENLLPPEDEWRSMVEEVTSELLNKGATRDNARITIGNEPMKDISKEEYVNYVNIAYDQIASRFDVGAGNEEYDLAMRSENMYEYLCLNAEFDILDIHIQSSMTTPESIEEKGDWFRDLADTHNKRLSVTEANWFDVSTPEGYQMLILQLEKAEDIGAEDFAVVFISLRDRRTYEWLSFIYDGNIRNEANWHDFRSRMIESKSNN
jgi:hypothetical protein